MIKRSWITNNDHIFKSFTQWIFQRFLDRQKIFVSGYNLGELKKKIQLHLGLLLLMTVTVCHSYQISDQNTNQNENEWSLFDGKTLDGWEITDFGLQGSVHVEDSSIILERGNGATGITWKGDILLINYEVTLEAMRVEGIDFFCGLTFPVYEDALTLVVGGWGGKVVGLSCIDGFDASDNETCLLQSFQNNRWYTIRLRVTEEAVTAWIDDKKLVDFLLEDHELSLRPEVWLSYPFGIASWRTTAALRNIKIKKIVPDPENKP